MEQEPIIPTGYKAKLPHTLSYPVGAKVISQALIGAPQFGQLTIDFSFWKRLARDHGTATPYPVLYVGYTGPLRYFSAPKSMVDYDAPRWTIRVEAVPRSLRHLIQSKIVNEALPSVRSWLIANTHSMERQGGHGLTFSFDELKSELTGNEQASIEWQTMRSDRP
jgi:hypothetical protein